MTARLGLPAELRELRFQIRQAVGKRLAIALFAALFQIVQNPRTVQEQALALLLKLKLLGREPNFSNPAVRIRRVDLRLDRFTFPTSGHIQLYACRPPGRPSWKNLG